MNLGVPTTVTPRTMPTKNVLVGQSVRLEPLSTNHLDALWQNCESEESSFIYLRYGPFATKGELADLIAELSTRSEQPFWAALPTASGKAEGWLSLCDIYPADAAIEIGSIWFSPKLQRTRAAREAMFLLMQLAMDQLGYQRLVWRCQAENQKSHDAANRLGFVYEGTWRNAAIVDAYLRSVAWFSILADEWPAHRAALQLWLSDENFDQDGSPRRSLSEIRKANNTNG